MFTLLVTKRGGGMFLSEARMTTHPNYADELERLNTCYTTKQNGKQIARI